MSLLPSLQSARPRSQSEPSSHEPLGRPVIRGKCFLRGEKKFRIQGVTYGPFAPDGDGIQFPSPRIVRQDFARMRQSGFNSARTYIVPPAWLLEVAAEQDVQLLIDIPWRKHVCFLESREAKSEARSDAKCGSRWCRTSKRAGL